MWAPLVQLLWGALLSIIGSMVGKVLIALGVGYVQYKGVEFLFNKLVDIINAQVINIPPQVLQVMSMLGLGVAFNLLLACITIKAALGGVFNGGLVKMIWNRTDQGGA